MRWIILLPASLVSGFLIKLFTHIFLYSSLVNGRIISGVSAKSIDKIEYYIFPFIFYITYILVAYEIAPKYKIRACVALIAIYLFLSLGLFFLIENQTYLDIPKLVSGILGLILGLTIILRRNKQSTIKDINIAPEPILPLKTPSMDRLGYLENDINLEYVETLDPHEFPKITSLSKTEILLIIEAINNSTEDYEDIVLTNREKLLIYEKLLEDKALKNTQNSKTPNEPFLALTTNPNGEYYGLFFVNPTKNHYTIKQLTGAFASGDSDMIETSKRVSVLPELHPESFVKIEDIHYTERDFVIWYEFDMTEEGGNVLYKRGGVSKSYRYNQGDKVFIDYGLKQEAWIEELKDRPKQESIDEITKTMNMDSRHIIFNENGSIKEEIS